MKILNWPLGAMRVNKIEISKQEKVHESYLKFLFHHIHQTSFIIMAGIQPVQVARMKILGIQSSIGRQVNIPLAFAHGSKFFFGGMLG